MQTEHIIDSNGRTRMVKSKEQQIADLEYLAEWYAEEKCEFCSGKGHYGYGVENNVVLPCTCLWDNISKEAKEKGLNMADFMPEAASMDHIKRKSLEAKEYKKREVNSHIYT